jgi:lysophospholipase L1-like esterase
MLGARDALVSELNGWSVTVWAQEGLSTLGAASIVAASHALIGDVVVVALGNNDAGNPATFGQRIDGVMQAIGPVPRVIWVNLRTFASWVPAMNQQLVLAPSRWPNLQIADWNSIATPNPGFVYGDGLHLTPAGQAAMARLVGQEVDAFVQSTTTTTTPTTTTTRPPRRRRGRPARALRYWPGLFGPG